MQDKSKKIKDKKGEGVLSFILYPLSSKGGFGLIEIVIATAIASLFLFGLLQTYTLAVKLLRNERELFEATLLADEALEAVRAMRDESWESAIAPLTNAAAYYPVIQNGKWQLATTAPTPISGKYTQGVVLDAVYRDSQDRVNSSGTLDPKTKKVTARVSWGAPSRQVELVTYIADFR